VNANLVTKSFPCKLIRVVNMKNSMVSLKNRHLISCIFLHAHQQNGSAERKHCHFVMLALHSLLMPLRLQKYQDEASLTTTFLINLLPSKVLNFDTHVEKLLQVMANYESLRVFACASWSNLRPITLANLLFHYKTCVFLGYSLCHKRVK
jgi:histone deacetylase 1/2